MKQFALLLILSLILLTSVGAGRRDTIPVIHFQLVDASNGKPIPLAHIVNSNRKKAVIADMLGYFKISIAYGDTLSISAIGFHDMHIPSWGQFTIDSLYYPIRLTPRFYEIKEVKITRFGSYQRFIKEAASMDLPKSEQEILQERLEDYFMRSITQMDLKSMPSATGGFAFGEDWLSKQRKKIEAKRIEEQKWDIILNKFSAGIVSELTSLEGIEAIRFMEFCDFTEGYLLISSDYEIRKRILDKFKVYKNFSN